MMRARMCFSSAVFAFSFISVSALSAPIPVSQRTLSEVMRDNLSGLSLQTEEERAQAIQEAHDFVEFRRNSKSMDSTLARACLDETQPSQSFFCRFVPKPVSLTDVLAEVPAPATESTQSGGGSGTPAVNPVELAELALRSGNLKTLKSLPESILNRALRSFDAPEALNRVTRAALRARRCVSGELLTALGMKTEEFFPEPGQRRLAADLYSRATSCANSASVTKARYRLSLLRIWNGQYAKAKRILDRLVGKEDAPGFADYEARALFWKAYCAKKLRSAKAATTASFKLLKEFPLHLHTLLAGKAARKKVVPRGEDPGIEFRSSKVTVLNEAARGAEALLAIGEPKLAVEVLNRVAAGLSEAEPEFQLYYGVLLSRAGDNLGNFRLLSSLFKESPEWMTKSSLQLFYPFKEIAQSIPPELELDPLLILSLIRQESAFNERATSAVGARGLMQVMPTTARLVEKGSPGLLYEAEHNVRIGSKYFKQLLERYEGDVELSLAAYNAGPHRVDAWKRRYPVSNRLLFMDLIPFKETREYVASIARNYYWYLSLYKSTGAASGASSAAGVRGPRFKVFD